MRGLDWAAGYFTPGWFQNKDIEDENQYKEDSFMNTGSRPERILCFFAKLAIQIIADKVQLSWQLGSIEYSVCVVGLCEVSSPKQQQRNRAGVRCCKE